MAPLPTFNRSTDPFPELISAEAIRTRVAELGAQITNDYAGHGEDLVLLAVLKGSVLFMAGLYSIGRGSGIVFRVSAGAWPKEPVPV